MRLVNILIVSLQSQPIVPPSFSFDDNFRVAIVKPVIIQNNDLKILGRFKHSFTMGVDGVLF